MFKVIGRSQRGAAGTGENRLPKFKGRPKERKVFSLLDYYPFPTFRLGHAKALEIIENHWKQFDVALIIAPMGSGKTALRRAIAYWTGSAAMTVPTNNLLEQEIRQFPDTNKIFRKNYYHCEFCYNLDMASIKESKDKPLLVVPHTYIAHKFRRPVLLVDEGHKLVDINTDLQSTHIWKKDVGYPITTYTREELVAFLKSIEAESMGKYRKILDKLETNDYMIKREVQGFRGKGMDRISIIPLYPETHPVLIKGVNKVLLFSATLSQEDVFDLGIGRHKKILKVELPSPIPKERRPLVLDYLGKLHRYNLKSKTPAIARRIRRMHSEYSDKGKGLVHVTYELGKYLRTYLEKEDWAVFHSKTDAKAKLAKWLESDPKEGKVFIASGFEEGLDLAGADFHWQAIAKIMWPSLMDTAVRKKMEDNEAWYYWQALKKVIQAYGRICRGPDDLGVTHIWDESFERLYKNSLKYDLIPEYFKEVYPK